MPPRPGQATKIFVGSAAASLLALLAFLGLFFSWGPSPPDALKVFLCLGALPGLFLWHAMGQRWWHVTSGEDAPAAPAVPPGEAHARFSLLNGEGMPFSAILERPGGAGVEKTFGHVLCLRYPELQRWVKPMTLVQYVSTGVLLWLSTDSARARVPCVVLPGAVVGMIVWLGWLVVAGPWCVVDVEESGCWLDETCAGFGRGKGRRRIVRALPDEGRLEVTLDDGGSMTLHFPGGSLEPDQQLALVCDLLRLHGVATTTDTPSDTSPYRQGT